MISVLVADAQPLQRFGFRMLLESTPDTEIVGEAGNGAEAVRRITELRPDVVLMDLRMPGVDGIEATRRIVAAGGRSRVLVLTPFDGNGTRSPRCGPGRAASCSRTSARMSCSPASGPSPPGTR